MNPEVQQIDDSILNYLVCASLVSRVCSGLLRLGGKVKGVSGRDEFIVAHLGGYSDVGTVSRAPSFSSDRENIHLRQYRSDGKILFISCPPVHPRFRELERALSEAERRQVH